MEAPREIEEDVYPNEEEADEPLLTITTQNVVATVNLMENLDLGLISKTAKNAEYNPQRFHAVIMRLRDPKTTALIFQNGKMIVTGAKKVEVAESAALKFRQIISRIVGNTVGFADFNIQNITATFDTGYPIRLESLILTHSSCATYEPELFPGLVYRMQDPKVVLLVFVSGKVVITGAKSIGDIQRAVESILDILTQYRKRNIIVSAVA